MDVCIYSLVICISGRNICSLVALKNWNAIVHYWSQKLKYISVRYSILLVESVLSYDISNRLFVHFRSNNFMLVANYCTFMGTFKNLQLILTGMIKVQVKYICHGKI